MLGGREEIRIFPIEGSLISPTGQYNKKIELVATPDQRHDVLIVPVVKSTLSNLKEIQIASNCFRNHEKYAVELLIHL